MSLADHIDSPDTDPPTSDAHSSGGMSDLIESSTDEQDTEIIQIQTLDYTTEYGKPVVHVLGSDESGSYRHIEVDGHRPSFCIRKEDYNKRVKNDHRVVDVEPADETTLDGDPLVQVYTKLPKHVGDDDEGMRGNFDETWEADVFYTRRWLFDNNIYVAAEVPSEGRPAEYGEYRVSIEDIEPADSLGVPPTIATVDIEVSTAGGFPDVYEADSRITAISAEADGTVHSWILNSEQWDEQPTVENTRFYDDEGRLLSDFNTWLGDQQPHIVTGWNSNSFDYPYLIARSKELNETHSLEGWSPLENLWAGRFGPRIQGVEAIDMMDAYKKTQYRKPKGGWGLDNIAEKETGIGKDHIASFDEAWHNEPAQFIEYNKRDVQAVLDIDASVGVMELYEDIRDITGVMYGDCHNNIDLLDAFFIRKANEWGYRLPTNEPVDEDWYYGAFVFESKKGRHQNVVYPDLASLYPNIIRTCNMSPETLVGTPQELAESEWTEDDCVHSYVDTRPVKRLDSGENWRDYTHGEYKAVLVDGETKWTDDPQYTKLYFLDPQIQMGFVPRLVDYVIELKERYRGTDMYDAVKRITNSIYGVLGDSDTYGKGFRLFDVRIAEAITLAGRKVIQATADEFVERVEHDGAYLVGGDTDSCMCALPRIRKSIALEQAQQAAAEVDEWYDQFAKETFDVDDHHFELEIESLASYQFVPEAQDGGNVKKRYCEYVVWDEDDGWIDGELVVTGMDSIRSDTAEITQSVIEKVLKAIVTNPDGDDAEQEARDIIDMIVQAVHDGDIGLDKLAKAKGMSKDPSEYGSAHRSAQPTYRGAKYANQHFDNEHITEGDKPMLLYVEDTGSYPSTYSTDTGEDGSEVDAIAVSDPQNVPDEIQVDRDKMITKTIVRPLSPIIKAMEWDFSDLYIPKEQLKVSYYM